MKIKKGDLVRVISGKDKGKEGKVLATDAQSNRVLVEGVNMVKKNQKAQGQEQGGIIDVEAPINVSKVVYLYNGKPTRIGIEKEVVVKNGKKTVVTHRIAKAAGGAKID